MAKSNKPMTDSSEKLDAYDMLLLVLHTSQDCQRISGRTTLQKIGYFASETLGLENDYSAHFYGPYSPGVAYALKRMTSLRLVKEERTVTYNDHLMFEYSLTPKGELYVKGVAEKYREASNTITKIVEKVANLEGDKIDRISKAAKVHYILKNDPRLSTTQIIQHARNLGWKISQQEVEESLELIKEIQ